jgi:hypothetical protein
MAQINHEIKIDAPLATVKEALTTVPGYVGGILPQ